MNALPPEKLEAMAKAAEAVNDHGEALYYRCLALGRPELAARAASVNAERSRIGHMTSRLLSLRYQITRELSMTKPVVAWEICQNGRTFLVPHDEFVRNSYDHGSFKALVYQ